MSSREVLPELVRDSRLQATVQQNLTIHTRPLGRRGVSRHETWEREKILGYGGYGVVWLERKVNDDGPAQLRAVKGIRISEPRTKGANYVRELEAMAKFSQDKVRVPGQLVSRRDVLMPRLAVCRVLRQIVRLVRKRRVASHRYGVLRTR
jgi:hypothetical protein